MKLTRALVKGRERRKGEKVKERRVSGGKGNVTNSEGSQ